MLLTQLEGKVSPEQWDVLQQEFQKAAQQLPPQIDQSYLVQDQNEKETWRVVTIWENRQALQDYRESVETPGGVLMFRAVNAEPTLSICEVIEYAQKD
jgi:hypothetical protein